MRSAQWSFTANFPRSFFSAINEDVKVCIGDTSLSKYIPTTIKPRSKRNRITYICESCIVAILIQLDLNKCRLTQLKKIDKLYINAAPTRTLQISKIDNIEYKYQTFLNNSHMKL